jgi:hypothetical protein
MAARHDRNKVHTGRRKKGSRIRKRLRAQRLKIRLRKKHRKMSGSKLRRYLRRVGRRV